VLLLAAKGIAELAGHRSLKNLATILPPKYGGWPSGMTGRELTIVEHC